MEKDIVETFSDLLEALLHFTHADKSYNDLIILDIRMPNPNGLQLNHQLKAINKDVKYSFCLRLKHVRNS
jgi:DNA-binding NarL/FixJ family response regulator